MPTCKTKFTKEQILTPSSSYSTQQPSSRRKTLQSAGVNNSTPLARGNNLWCHIPLWCHFHLAKWEAYLYLGNTWNNFWLFDTINTIRCKKTQNNCFRTKQSNTILHQVKLGKHGCSKRAGTYKTGKNGKILLNHAILLDF